MAFALFACAALLAPKPVVLTPALKHAILEGIGTTLRSKAFVPGVDFTTWPKIAHRHASAFASAKGPDAFALEIDRALFEYGVSHLSVIPPGRRPGAKMRAFGFVSNVYKGKVVVSHVFPGTQAAREGLYPGLILSTFDFPDYPDTDRIEIGYEKGGAAWTTTIAKESFVPRQEVDLVWGDTDTCVLKVPTFSADYDEKTLEKLVANAARFPNLILDLRGNGGGLPQHATHLLGAFLPPGTRIGAAISPGTLRAYAKSVGRPAAGQRAVGQSAADRAEMARRAPTDDALIVRRIPKPYTGHVAVLIDGGSASAAEVVATALRDYAQIAIFGTRSAGMVLFSDPAPLPGGYLLAFPYSDYWTAKGERLEGRPVTPDVEAAEGSDETSVLPYPLRLKAIEWLRAKYPAKSHV